MIVLLTDKGEKSQWVNQEIGYAYAIRALWKRLDRKSNHPIIIPISNSQAELKKGFITKDSIDVLFRDDVKKYPDFNYVMAYIIGFIRSCLPRGLDEGVLHVKVTCSCLDKKGTSFEYKVKMPSDDTISKKCQSGLLTLETKCPQCHKQNDLDIRTFVILKS